MKLLIVDDEQHVITALRMLIPARRLGITQILSTQSYEEAKVLLEREAPQIAIVDIILEYHSGLGIMSFVQHKHLNTQIIAISGHSDYEYVRTMLLGGAVDYLLKPIEPEALNAALEKAVQRIANGSRPGEDASLPQASADHIAHNIRVYLGELLKDGRERAFSLNAEVRPLPLAGMDRCILMYYDTEYLPICSNAFRRNLNAFEEKLTHYVRIHRCGAFLDRILRQSDRLLLMADEERHTGGVRDIIAESFGPNLLSFHMGLVRHVPFPAGFAGAFAIVRGCFFRANCRSVPEMFVTTPYEPRAQALAPGENLQRQLLSRLILKDVQGLCALLEGWLSGAMQGKDAPLGLVKELIEQFIALQKQWIAALGRSFPKLSCAPITDITYVNFLDEHLLFSKQMLVETMLHCARRLCTQAGEQLEREDLFERVSLYISLNFRQPFSQAEYARIFHINKDYLSRKFKTVFGEGMVSYVNRLRIEEAARLLKNPDLKIRQIAYQTGFSDEKYFTRQFKAFMNMSPSEYRAIIEKRPDADA